MKKPKLYSLEAVSARRMRANEARRFDLEQTNRIVAALDPRSANYQSPKRMAQGKMLAEQAAQYETKEEA